MVNTDEWKGYDRVGNRRGRVHRRVGHSGPKCTWAVDQDGDGVPRSTATHKKDWGRVSGTCTVGSVE